MQPEGAGQADDARYTFGLVLPLPASLGSGACAVVQPGAGRVCAATMPVGTAMVATVAPRPARNVASTAMAATRPDRDRTPAEPRPQQSRRYRCPAWGSSLLRMGPPPAPAVGRIVTEV